MQKFTVITRKGKFYTNNFKVALKVFQEDFEERKREKKKKIRIRKELEKELKKLEKAMNKTKKNFNELKEEKRKELTNGNFTVGKLKRITKEWIEATGTKVGARAIVEKAFIDIIYEITSSFDEERLKEPDIRREAIKMIKRMIKALDEWEKFYKAL